MPREMFDSALEVRSTTRKSGRSLAVSATVHVAVLLAAVIVPLVATDTVLPSPRRVMQDYVLAKALPVPPSTGQIVRPRVAPAADAVPTGAPTEAPAGIAEESGLVAETQGVEGALDLGQSSGLIEGAGTAVDLVAPPPPPPPAPPSPRRIGGQISAPHRVRFVSPVYPPIAAAARVEGTVVLDAIIDVEGRVTDVRVLRSVALLDQAAIDAVLQWQYTPTLLNGVPVPVVMTVSVAFRLPR